MPLLCLLGVAGDQQNFHDVTSPDPERADARRLRIDYIKPSCFNRRGRPRLAGGGGSETGRPAGDGAGCVAGGCGSEGRGRGEVAGSKQTFEALERENADLRHRLKKAHEVAKKSAMRMQRQLEAGEEKLNTVRPQDAIQFLIVPRLPDSSDADSS